MKKYYILAFTFLCLLMVSTSYGQMNNNGDYSDTGDICDTNSMNYDMCGCNHYAWCQLEEICVGGGCPDNDDSNDPCDYSSSSYDICVCNPNLCDSNDPCDQTSRAYDYNVCNNNDNEDDDDYYCYYYPEECYPDNPEPENCTKTCSNGYELVNCECVKIPCTTTCDSGYKRNEETCECELDPCFNKDLRHKKLSTEIDNLINQRTQTVFMNGSYVDNKSFEIQEIEDGWGDINLDKYSLNITNLPNNYTPQMLFEEIRTNLSDFVKGGNNVATSVKLEPYSTTDGVTWNSGNPIGAAMDFNNIMDTSTVICTEYDYNEMYWTFTTVRSLDHQGHFVSGHRQFGIETNGDGSYSFFLRGADRLGQYADFVANGHGTGQDYLFNNAADATWKTFMTQLENFIKAKTGAEVESFDENKIYAKRYEYNEDDCPE